MNIFKKLFHRKENSKRQTVKEFEQEHNVTMYHADGRNMRDDGYVDNVDKNQKKYISRKIKKN